MTLKSPKKKTISVSKKKPHLRIASENDLARLFLSLKVKIALQGYLSFFASKDSGTLQWVGRPIKST